MSDAPIVTERLKKRYPNGTLALDGIDISIGKGDVAGFLGPNGAGKSTMLKILTNLIRPTSGRALINGIDVSARPKEALCSVGALIEVPGLYSYLTPVELLDYIGKVHGLRGSKLDDRISRTLAKVRLDEWSSDRLGSFSTGMQRRLAIALAIVHDPSVLILDEPVLGLDPKGIKEVRDIILELQREGKTILMSSHLLSEVAETCNRVILISHGRILASDTVEGLEKRLISRKLRVEFVDHAESIMRTIEGASLSVNGVSGVSRGNEPDTVIIEYDGKKETASALLAKLVSLGLGVIEFAAIRPSLEDVYVSVLENDETR